jgi:hypothetical protein
MNIFEEVAHNLGNISAEEVQKIYQDYVRTVSKEMSASPAREIYFPKFGKFSPSVLKIKKRLKIFFKLREVEKTKKMINTLRILKNKK